MTTRELTSFLEKLTKKMSEKGLYFGNYTGEDIEEAINNLDEVAGSKNEEIDFDQLIDNFPPADRNFCSLTDEVT